MAPGFTEPGATTRLLTNTIEKYIHFYKLQNFYLNNVVVGVVQLNERQIWRRNVVRRYVLRDSQ